MEHDPLSGRRWRTALWRSAGVPVVMPGLAPSAPHSAPDRLARLVGAWDSALRSGAQSSQVLELGGAAGPEGWHRERIRG